MGFLYFGGKQGKNNTLSTRSFAMGRVNFDRGKRHTHKDTKEEVDRGRDTTIQTQPGLFVYFFIGQLGGVEERRKPVRREGSHHGRQILHEMGPSYLGQSNIHCQHNQAWIRDHGIYLFCSWHERRSKSHSFG